ncbi:hypothetical protein [Okeania sp. SIO3B5]|uniref:hypothetical protein n=1 Tax=Okeania sp. SIO3B5 TaxID=2607811 RepID=UPI0034514AA6
MEGNEASRSHGQVMLGILVVQDLSLGLMLAVLPALNQPPEIIGIQLRLLFKLLVNYNTFFDYGLKSAPLVSIHCLTEILR